MTTDDEPLTEEEYRQVVMGFVRAIADDKPEDLGAPTGDRIAFPPWLVEEARRLIRLRWTVRTRRPYHYQCPVHGEVAAVSPENGRCCSASVLVGVDT